jgi:hypothetical protein
MPSIDLEFFATSEWWPTKIWRLNRFRQPLVRWQPLPRFICTLHFIYTEVYLKPFLRLFRYRRYFALIAFIINEWWLRYFNSEKLENHMQLNQMRAMDIYLLMLVMWKHIAEWKVIFRKANCHYAKSANLDKNLVFLVLLYTFQDLKIECFHFCLSGEQFYRWQWKSLFICNKAFCSITHKSMIRLMDLR